MDNVERGQSADENTTKIESSDPPTVGGSEPNVVLSAAGEAELLAPLTEEQKAKLAAEKAELEAAEMEWLEIEEKRDALAG